MRFIAPLVITAAGIAVLAIFQPTYDQIWNGQWPTQLAIIIVGCLLTIGGIVGAVAAIRG